MNIDAPERTPWTIHRGALRVVLSQLIQNSLDHAAVAGDGELEINLTVRLSKQTPKQWNLEYTDNGRGIDREQVELIFNPFHTTRKAAGHMGLGLHIAYLIASRQLGGSLEFFPEDCGVHFRLMIAWLAPAVVSEPADI